MFPSPEHRRLFLTTLRTLGVTKLVIGFAGGGDQGDIEQVEATNAQGTLIPLTDHIPWSFEASHFESDTKSWKKFVQEKTVQLEKIAKELTLKALEEQGLDWYNNDGGQGSLEIDFATTPPTITLDVGINYTSTEEHSFDLSEE